MITFESIEEKALAGARISEQDALFLFQSPELVRIGMLANHISEKKNDDKILYNINRHINPTNICVYDCKFCAYAKKPGEDGAYAYSIDQIIKRTEEAVKDGATEIHMVGGLHPRWKYSYYKEILRAVKSSFPDIHIKGFTAVEIDWLARKARLSIKDTLLELNEAGLDSLPGGGAEIFHQDIRDKITAKLTAEQWIDIHRIAHNIGMHSNCTMLYGHIEDYAHRVDHMRYLRNLQDETGGFNAFIPLSFQPHQNEMGIKRYTFGVDDLKTIAVARLYLDNFQHLKAYWIMLGQDIAQLATKFGANDFDGTVVEEKISKAAGGRSGMHLTKEKLEHIIHKAEKSAQQRDTVYNPIGLPSVCGARSPIADDILREINKSPSKAKIAEVAEHAHFHKLLRAASNIAISKTEAKASFEVGIRFSAQDINSLKKDGHHEKLDHLKPWSKIVFDIGDLDPEAHNLNLNDIKHTLGRFTLNECILASHENLWEISQQENIPYSDLCSQIHQAGATKIISSDFKSETSLTHSQVEMLYTSAAQACGDVSGKVEILSTQSGSPLWETYVDRLLVIQKISKNKKIKSVSIQPSPDSEITPVEYLRAVAIARLILPEVEAIITPLTAIPTLSNKMGIGTEYTQHPQEKIVGLCLLSGSSGLGVLEEREITVASIIEDIRSAGLEPCCNLRSQSLIKSTLENLDHMPNLLNSN